MYTHIWSKLTDTERRSQNSSTAPCKGVISHGAPIGVFKFLPTTHTETNTNKMCPRSSCTMGYFTCGLSSCSDHSTYTLDKSSQEKPEYPQLEPHARIRIVQVLGSLVYICVHASPFEISMIPEDFQGLYGIQM